MAAHMLSLIFSNIRGQDRKNLWKTLISGDHLAVVTFDHLATRTQQTILYFLVFSVKSNKRLKASDNIKQLN